MKKILSICLAAAAFVGCTNTSVEFDTPDEIGFVVAANGITRNVVAESVYPTTLNMYVYSWTNDFTSGTPNYINGVGADLNKGGEFEYRNAYNVEVPGKTGYEDDETPVWGGLTPYYWPNVKTLHFAGYSKSGTMTSATYAVTGAGAGTLTIAGYTPGIATAAGANDLMYFPATTAYGKDTPYVPVTMYHTCSWITFLVQGDDVTAGKYTVTGLTINGIDNQADVVCGASSIVWSNNAAADTNREITFDDLALPNAEDEDAPYNVETGDEYAVADGGNIVVIPQTPGTLTLTYTYTSPAGQDIEEVKDNISLAVDAVNNKWEPGKHYVYTITIKANEILIAPEAEAWDEDADNNITIE